MMSLYFAIFLISFASRSRCSGVRSLLSFAPMSLSCCSPFSSTNTPHNTMGPRTGPRRASSIPQMRVIRLSRDLWYLKCLFTLVCILPSTDAYTDVKIVMFEPRNAYKSRCGLQCEMEWLC